MKLYAVLGVCLLGLGCANSLVTPDEIRGGGDSDQDVLTCEGPCSISSDGTVWQADTLEGGKLIWITQTQANAERDAKIVEAAGEIAIKAFDAALPTP